MRNNVKIQNITTIQSAPDAPAVETVRDLMLINGYVVATGPVQRGTQRLLYDGAVNNIESAGVYKGGQIGQLAMNLSDIAAIALFFAVIMSNPEDQESQKMFWDVPLLKIGDNYVLGSVTSTGFQIYDNTAEVTKNMEFAKNFMKSNGFDDAERLTVSVVAITQ